MSATPPQDFPRGFRPDLAAGLQALRDAHDFATAFSQIETEMSRVFVNNTIPDQAGDLLTLVVLAARKASLMKEIAGGDLVDSQGNHAGWAIPAEQFDQVINQILGFFQLALAAGGQLINQARAGEATIARPFLAAELDLVRQDFLSWQDSIGPGGLTLPALPAQFGQILFSQLWGLGDFAGAEDMLFLVRELLSNGQRSDQETGTADVAAQFYSQLLRLTDQELTDGGLPREEIMAALAELHIGV